MGKAMSESERIIMEILWEYGPLSAAQVTSLAREKQNWSYNTVRTFLTRLKEKKAVTVEQRDKYYYAPSMTREEAGLQEARHVVKRLYDGSVKQLIACFLDQEELSEEDLDELSLLLEKKRREV